MFAEGIHPTAETVVLAVWVPARRPGRRGCVVWLHCSDSNVMNRHTSAFSRHVAPEFCKFVRPKKIEGRRRPSREGAARSQEGRREDRVRAAPAVSRAKGSQKSAHEHTGSAEAVRPSLRNGVTAYIVLSPARPGLFVTVIPKKLPSWEFDTCHRGVRTTRLCRPRHAPFVKSASAATASHPNVSDDGQRPLSRNGMARNKQLIWVRSQEQFLKIRNYVEV